MNHNDALSVLGLTWDEGEDRAAVKAAWARYAKEAHPDTNTNELSTDESAAQISKLTEARETLLAHIGGTENACKLCKGTGKVRGRLGAQDCGACRGTGDKTP